MADSAAHLRDCVFPSIPVRQWVFTLPKRLRFLLAWRPGVALPLAENVLLVSALDSGGASEVVLLGTMTHATGTFNGVIGQSHDSGGLHRAHQIDVFAWADTKATPMGMTGTGTVFVIK